MNSLSPGETAEGNENRASFTASNLDALDSVPLRADRVTFRHSPAIFSFSVFLFVVTAFMRLSRKEPDESGQYELDVQRALIPSVRVRTANA